MGKGKTVRKGIALLDVLIASLIFLSVGLAVTFFSYSLYYQGKVLQESRLRMELAGVLNKLYGECKNDPNYSGSWTDTIDGVSVEVTATCQDLGNGLVKGLATVSTGNVYLTGETYVAK